MIKGKGRLRCHPLIAAGIFLTGLLIAGCVAPEPGAFEVISDSRVRCQNEVVWAGPGDASLLPRLQDCNLSADEGWAALPAGGLITTDDNGEGWVGLNDCATIYIFRDSRLVKAACPKSDYIGGNVFCDAQGLVGVNYSCNAQVVIQTLSAEVVLKGTWLLVIYLPDRRLTVVMVFEGVAEMRPVLDFETRTLGEATDVAQGNFWFTAPNDTISPIEGLAGREPHPFEQLPPLIDALDLEPWLDRTRDRAIADGIPFPDLGPTPTPTHTPTFTPTWTPTATFTQLPSPTPKPDLVVQIVSIGSGTIVQGEQPWTWITYAVSNVGDASTPGDVFLRAWANGSPTSGYMVVAGPIPPSGSAESRFAVGHDNGWPVGNYTVQLEVDYQSLVDETDENNNFSNSIQFTVVPPVTEDDFIGDWYNVDSNTDGTTRIIISKQDGSVYVHGYGSCVPTDCDWGTVQAQLSGSTLVAEYQFSFMVSQLTMTLTDNGLRVFSTNRFTDGTNRDYDATEYFSLLVDDSDQGITYTTAPQIGVFGSWRTDPDPNCINGTQHYTRNVGDKAIFSFTGDWIEVVYYTSPNMGIMRVTIDGELVAEIDCNTPTTTTTTYQVFQRFPDLGDGSHTIVVEYAGRGSAPLVEWDPSIVIDAFRIPGSQSPDLGPTPTDTPTATPTDTTIPTDTPTPIPLSDLVITKFETNGPVTVNSDGRLQLPIRVDVTNWGNRDANIFKVAILYLDRDGYMMFIAPFTVPGSDYWAPFTSAPLAPGRTWSFEGTVTFDSRLEGQQVALFAMADSCASEEFMPDYCRVEEINEDNNAADPLLGVPLSLPPIR